MQTKSLTTGLVFLFYCTISTMARPVHSDAGHTDTVPVSSTRLLQLKTPDERVRKYVNFDVIKLMLGTSFVTNHPGRERFGMPFRVQVLYPYSINRTKTIPFAIGFTAGVNRFSIRRVSFEYTGKELTAIRGNSNIRRSIHRNSYAGITALMILRFNKLRWLTIMTGPSFEINSAGTITEMRDGLPNQVFRNSHTLRRISAPYHFQLSIAKKQLLSFGTWISVPTVPIFRGNTYKDFKQFQLGVSFALIF